MLTLVALRSPQSRGAKQSQQSRVELFVDSKNRKGSEPAAEAPASVPASTVEVSPAPVAAPWYAAIKNRFNRQFGTAVFQTVDAEVTTAERTGNKRKKLADVLIPQLGPDGEPNGSHWRGIIALKQRKGDTQAYYDMTIPGSGFNQAISTDDDPAAAAEYKQWCESVIDAFLIYAEANGRSATAAPPTQIKRKVAGFGL